MQIVLYCTYLGVLQTLFIIHFTIFHNSVGNDAGFLDVIRTYDDRKHLYNGQSHWFLNEVPCYWNSTNCNFPYFICILITQLIRKKCIFTKCSCKFISIFYILGTIVYNAVTVVKYHASTRVL